MKNKTLLAIIFFITFCQTGSSQKVFPSFSDSAKWNVLECVYGIGYTCNTLTYQYQYDTLFCGNNYSVIHMTGYDSKTAYIRSDSVRSYCRKNNNCNDKEYLLYDFSMNIGDTTFTSIELWYNSYPSDTTAFVLNSVDTIVLNGFDRRVFHLLYNSPGTGTDINRPMDWIEGIGSTTHPFYSLACLQDGCETSWRLLCLDSSGVQLYHDSTINTCDTSYSTIEINELTSTNHLSIYPNPFDNILTVSITNATISEIEILNLVGERINIFKGNKKNNLRIDELNYLQAGIYLIKVHTNKGLLTEKIIKME
jgi:hypothetical protein